MKILVVCQYYYPEPFKITEICEDLVQRGHIVTVLTGLPNYPDGIIPFNYRSGKLRKEVINSVNVIRCFEIPRKKGAMALGLNYVSYMISASLKSLFLIKDEFDIYILGDTDINNYIYKNVSVKKDFVNLSFSEGDKLIKASDLVITINCFSNCLVRAAYYKVPTLTFVNKKDIEVRNGKVSTLLDYELTPFNNKLIKNITSNNGVIKKYLIFPENKVELMEQFYKKNHEFAGINLSSDIFDEKNSINTIKNLLYQKDEMLLEHQKNLKKITVKLLLMTRLSMR